MLETESQLNSSIKTKFADHTFINPYVKQIVFKSDLSIDQDSEKRICFETLSESKNNLTIIRNKK